MNNVFGKIYIVATPIGNLKDITLRAVEVLNEVDYIVAEDTRHTLELLNHLDIKTKLISYHEHSSDKKVKEIIDILKEGNDIALVTDAGTPIISDPGNELVKNAIEENIEITSVPGACAAINALVMSGLDAKSFVFVGFLSDDKKKKKKQLEELANETRTMIFYISPHNVLKDLDDLIDTFGESRNASMSREMTKKFEETRRGELIYLKEYYSKNLIKGEFVMVVSGLDREVLKEKEASKWQEMSVEEHMSIYLKDGLSEKDAMKQVAKDRGLDKREIYKILKIN